MRSMREFYPDRPARLHEVLNDKVVTWRTGIGGAMPWPTKWLATVAWDGLIFDGWEPSGADVRR
jgi:hypothetical protein